MTVSVPAGHRPAGPVDPRIARDHCRFVEAQAGAR